MNIKTIITAALASLLLALPVFSQSQIRAGRAIQITIQGVPPEERARIDGIYPVGESGSINMPFIGTIRAAGLRPEVLALNIQNAYRQGGFYRSPTIQVIASSAETIDDQVVHVGGQVRNAGPVKFIQGLTLYQAVQSARGATEFGSMKRVKLFRAGRQRQYDLTRLQDMNVLLEPNDTIEVPQKNIWGN